VIPGDRQLTQRGKLGCLWGQRWIDNRQVIDSIGAL